MNDGTLSQHEIDALLAGAGDAYENGSSLAGGTGSLGVVNTGDMASLLEIVILTLQKQSDYLQNIYQQNFQISNVKTKIKENVQVRSELTGKLVQIRMDFSSGVIGENLFILHVEEAISLVEAFTKQTNVELSDVSLSALSEGFVHIMNAYTTALSDKLDRKILVNPPQIELMDDSSQLYFPDESQVVHVTYTLSPENGVNINFNQILSIPLAKELITLVKSLVLDGSLIDTASTDIDISSDMRVGVGPLSTIIRPIKYQELAKVTPGEALSKNNIGLLLDISMQLTVELGRTKMQIKKILGLGEGSIIELDKLAGEPVDLLVNGKLIAQGEVVVIDENFGVRITEIVGPHERLDSIISD